MKRTRKAAIHAGERRYLTGKACKHGHVSMRYTLNACCAICQTLNAHARRQKDRTALMLAEAKKREAVNG